MDLGYPLKILFRLSFLKHNLICGKDNLFVSMTQYLKIVISKDC